jgi:hypothetical protein
MEEERRIAGDIAEVAGTKVPGLNELNKVAHRGVDTVFDVCEGIPFIEHAHSSKLYSILLSRDRLSLISYEPIHDEFLI